MSDEITDLCVHHVKQGIFDIEWSCATPGCGRRYIVLSHIVAVRFVVSRPVYEVVKRRYLLCAVDIRCCHTHECAREASMPVFAKSVYIVV